MADTVSKAYANKGRTASVGQASRPFQCKWHEGCLKSFNRKSDLQRHYRIHTNERPYACDYKPCEKTFIQRSALTVHRRTHTGDKPHKCPYNGCGKCFSDSSSLARHRRIHTNDKPYICKNALCRKAFCRKTTMTKHFRKEHPADALKDEEDADFSDIDDSDDDSSEQEHATDVSYDEHQVTFPTSEPCRDRDMPMREASVYSTDLWALPGRSQASKPRSLRGPARSRRDSAVDLVKLERSLSHTPQRTFTDPYPMSHEDHAEYMQTRSNTMPQSVIMPASLPPSIIDSIMQGHLAESSSADRVWPNHSAMSDSPTSLASSSSGLEPAPRGYSQHPYELQSIGMARHQMTQLGSGQHVTDLQGVQDIVLEDLPPRKYSPVAAAQHHRQVQYTSTPQQQSRQPQDLQPQQLYDNGSLGQYPADLHPSGTPTEPLFATPVPEQYQEPQALPQDAYNMQPTIVPTRPYLYNIHDYMDPMKRNDDVYAQLPNQLMGGGAWGNTWG